MTAPEQPSQKSESTAPDVAPAPSSTAAGSATRIPSASVAYSSRATAEFSDSDLVDLLAVSRDNNARLGLTGVLLFREGRFLQYIEGPQTAVTERIDIIAADPRHDEFQIRFRGSIGARLFPSWSMGFERVSDEMAEEIPGYRRSFVDVSRDRDRDERHAHGAMSDVARWFTSRQPPTDTPA